MVVTIYQQIGNVRRYGIVNYNFYTYNEHKAEFNSITDQLDYDELLSQCLLTVPVDTIIKVKSVNKESDRDKYWMDMFSLNQEIFDEEPNKIWRLQGILKAMDVNDEGHRHSLKTFLMKQSDVIKYSSNTQFMLKNFLTKLSVLNTVNTSNILMKDEVNDIQSCSKEWERILKELKPQDPNDPSNNLRYVNDTYDKELVKDSTNKEYICTAKYTKEYEAELNSGSVTPDRKSEHLIPTFFVYESDTMSLDEQKALLKKANTNNIYTATFSGSKSVHYLVPIEQSQANEIKKDFKYYWNKAGEIVFNKDIMKSMDANCASIGRLSRNPNAYRKIGNAKVKQDLLFKNDEVIPVNLHQIIQEHNQELKSKEEFNNLKLKVNESIKAQLPQLNNKKDKDYLERCYNKSHNENVGMALQVLNGIQLPKGSNLVGIASTLKIMEVDLELRKQIITLLKQQHPTNMPKEVKEYL